MSGFFSAQLALHRETKGDECSRSGDCEDATVEIQIWQGAHQIERCQWCNKARGVVMPAHLGNPASVAVRLDNLKEGGARFDYPNALTPFEWTVIEALQSARRSDLAEEGKSAKKESELQQRAATMPGR